MHKRGYYFLLALGFFLAFSLSASHVSAKKPESAKEAVAAQENISAAHVSGFRSAKFSMTEKDVYRAILIDFNIPKEDVARNVHPTEKTVTLGIKAHGLIPDSGTAHIFYIFGYRSQKLMQVNVIWGNPVDPEASPQGIVSTANQLRDHFLKEGFQREGMAVNARLPDGSILVFRGKDRLGHMAILLLQSLETSAGDDKKLSDTIKNMSLRLSYIEKPEAPDIFKINKGDF